MPSRTAIVADDTPEVLECVARILTIAGYEVRRASSGSAALKLFRQQPPDLVVTDLLMPDGDGIEVITGVRTAGSAARILAMSGGGGPLTPEYLTKMAKSLGADAVIYKPFEVGQIMAAIDALFAEPAAASERATQN